MSSLSWEERARRRGAGMELFKPPGEALTAGGWHLLMTHEGPKTLEWRPGIDIWRGPEGQRWTAEAAGELHWSYVGAVDEPT